MAVYHSFEELLADAKGISKDRYRDGVVLYEPKRTRRLEGEGRKEIRLRWPADFQRRVIAVVNWAVDRFGQDVGREVICRRLEIAHPDEKELE